MGSTLVHLLAAVGVFLWLENSSAERNGSFDHDKVTGRTGPIELSQAVAWFSPADFEASFQVTPPEPVAEALPESTPKTPAPAKTSAPPAATKPADPNARAEAKYIMVSRRDPASTPGEAPFTQQVAQAYTRDLPGLPSDEPSADSSETGEATRQALDAIDEALYEAFMTAWVPPPAQSLPPSKRSARLDLSMDQAMNLIGFDLVLPSGSSAFDLSILGAAEAVQDALASRSANGSTPLGKFPPSLPSSFSKPRYDCRITFNVE